MPRAQLFNTSIANYEDFVGLARTNQNTEAFTLVFINDGATNNLFLTTEPTSAGFGDTSGLMLEIDGIEEVIGGENSGARIIISGASSSTTDFFIGSRGYQFQISINDPNGTSNTFYRGTVDKVKFRGGNNPTIELRAESITSTIRLNPNRTLAGTLRNRLDDGALDFFSNNAEEDIGWTDND